MIIFPGCLIIFRRELITLFQKLISRPGRRVSFRARLVSAPGILLTFWGASGSREFLFRPRRPGPGTLRRELGRGQGRAVRRSRRVAKASPAGGKMGTSNLIGWLAGKDKPHVNRL